MKVGRREGKIRRRILIEFVDGEIYHKVWKRNVHSFGMGSTIVIRVIFITLENIEI